MKKYTFQCPICAKFFTHDEPGEPCCTGPSESRDDHVLEVMRLVRIENVDVNPARAEQRANGKLVMPANVIVPGRKNPEEELQKEALILTSR